MRKQRLRSKVPLALVCSTDLKARRNWPAPTADYLAVVLPAIEHCWNRCPCPDFTRPLFMTSRSLNVGLTAAATASDKNSGCSARRSSLVACLRARRLSPHRTNTHRRLGILSFSDKNSTKIWRDAPLRFRGTFAKLQRQSLIDCCRRPPEQPHHHQCVRS